MEAFGREIRYTIVKGSLAGHSKKQLFERTRPTRMAICDLGQSVVNYRWHPFNAGQQDTQEQYIELPAPNCDMATHIETSIVRNQRSAGDDSLHKGDLLNIVTCLTYPADITIKFD